MRMRILTYTLVHLIVKDFKCQIAGYFPYIAYVNFWESLDRNDFE